MLNRNIPIFILVGVFLLVFIFSSSVGNVMYTIQSGSVGVLSTFGKFDEEERTPGLHFKAPFFQDIRIFDIKLQTANYLSYGHSMSNAQTQRIVGETLDGVINNPQIRVLDSKSLPVDVELSVQYTPLADQANIILTEYGENYFEKLINPLVREIVRDVIGKYQAEDIVTKRTDIASETQSRLNTELGKRHFRLENVSLRNIILPEVVLKKIEEVQLAKQEEQRLAVVEQQTKKNQQIKTIEAETKMIEVTTQAKAEAEKKRIDTDAAAYQIAAESKARAEANKMISQSLTHELINYRIIEQWDGRYPQTLIGTGENGGLILSLPNPAAQQPTQ